MDNNYGNKKTMAKNITRYMEIKGIDRLDLCEATGIKYTTLVGWLKEQTYPRIDKIELLANYFGITKADGGKLAAMTDHDRVSLFLL